jgi:membrane peptidoglycan carboxypeptidase
VKLLELTSAYGSFATGGEHFVPLSILKVTDKNDNVIFENRAVAGKRVFTPEVSFLMSHILSDNVARQDVFGPVSYLVVPGKTVAVKTGTTDLKRDNWSIGYTPSVVVGVWVGNNDNTVMSPTIASGVTGATPIWNKIMKVALKDKKEEQFAKPDSVNAVLVDSLSGGLPHGSDPVRSEYFARGTEPIAISAIYKKIKVAKADGKLANDLQKKSGDYDEKEFIVISESDSVSLDGKNHWQEAIDKWIAENRKDDSRFHPPTDVSSADIDSVKINFDSPHDHERIDSNTIQVKAKAFSARDITKMTIIVDGNEKISKSTDNLDETIHLDNGKYEIKIRAQDSGGNSSEATVKIGVNQAWDYSPPGSPSAMLFNFNSQFLF